MTQRDRKPMRWGPHLPQLTERRWVPAQGEEGARPGSRGEGRKGRRKPTASLSWGDKSSGFGETEVLTPRCEFPRRGIRKESWSAQDVSSRDQKELSKRISGISALPWAGKSTWSHQPDGKSYYSLGSHERVFPWGREIISLLWALLWFHPIHFKSKTQKVTLFPSKWTASKNKAQEHEQECKSHPTPNKVKFTMASIHITRHAKKQENRTCHETNWSNTELSPNPAISVLGLHKT